MADPCKDWRTRAIGWLLAAGVPIAPAAAQTVAPLRAPSDIPIEHFFRSPTLRQPVLSPDGRHVAMIVPGPEGRAVLVAARTETPRRVFGVAHIPRADIVEVAWVNDRRLVFSIDDLGSRHWEPWSGTLYAVDVDGKDPVGPLGQGPLSPGAARVWSLRLAHLLRDGSDDIIVTRFNRGGSSHDAGSLSPMRVPTRQQAAPRTIAWDEPRHAVHWAFNGAGEPLAAQSVDWKNGNAVVWWRPDAKSPWEALARYNVLVGAPDFMMPLAVLPDGRLIVRSRRDDAARTDAIFRYDPRRREREREPLVAVREHDVGDDIVMDRRSGQLAGGLYVADAAGMAWVDPELQAVQRRVDALLPQTTNLLACDPCGGQDVYLVTSWSDRQAPAFHLFDRRQPDPAALRMLGASRPVQPVVMMATQEVQRVPARDGASIPVIVTRPLGKGPWPAVVLVHGGPWERGPSWGWRGESQFLASRGYLVIEPDYRGSTGYGDQWHRAGFRQWGAAMQDDITDATRWAVRQGLADERRLAIAGHSWGGYAALMGLVREPTLYRAGIASLAPTDPERLHSDSGSDQMDSHFGRLWLRDSFPIMVGDPDREPERFAAMSPQRRAGEIVRPVMLSYGGRDRRVPVAHGTRMRDALKAAGRAELEWVLFEEESHGYFELKTQVEFWTRVEKFLARHLAP